MYYFIFIMTECCSIQSFINIIHIPSFVYYDILHNTYYIILFIIDIYLFLINIT